MCQNATLLKITCHSSFDSLSLDRILILPMLSLHAVTCVLFNGCIGTHAWSSNDVNVRSCHTQHIQELGAFFKHKMRNLMVRKKKKPLFV